MESTECVVVGAGVIGLAVARALALEGRETIVVEAEPAVGTGISSRSSEVIHAGLYYHPGTLKALLCSEGMRELYAFCEARGVPYLRCGKLVVATSAAEIAPLEKLLAQAAGNGAVLTPLSANEARAMEPELRCEAAFHSPATGILDAHAYMHALLGEAEAHGAILARRTRLAAISRACGGFRLTFGDDIEPTLETRLIVNAAGLGAPEVASMLAGAREGFVPKVNLAKGSYFGLAGHAPFSRLIYPVPDGAGLGIHFTLDMRGQTRFGPDVEWIREADFHVEATRALRFYEAIRRYWPGLRDGALMPAYAGVRPKLHGPGEKAADFMIAGPERHGEPGFINLFGIESPGFTASLAIGTYVATLVREALA